MNIDEWKGKTADELEALSDAQIKEYFSPFLIYIQPLKKTEEKQGKLSLLSPSKRPASVYNNVDKAMEMAQRLAKQLGVKL